MFVFDFEVLKYDWLVVIKDVNTNKYYKIHNSKNELNKIFEENKDKLWFSYNGNHYDYPIFRAILSGVDPYIVSNLIIKEGKKPWLVERSLKIKSIPIKTCDLMIDLHQASLKELEAYMQMSIEESSIPFDIDRPLTNEEIEILFKYCVHDVDATSKLLENRTGYLKSKFILMKMFDLPITILSKTSAQIAALVLQAQKIDRKEDALKYDFPDTLVLNKYNEMIPLYNKELNYDEKMSVNVAGVDHIYAFGGLHGAIPNFRYVGEMWQVDATSYYPTMILNYNYIRNIKDFERYRYIYTERVKQKKLDFNISDALKLVLNATFGAMKAPFNDLFDEHNSNQICISGQLFITDLIEKIEPYCKLIQTNTDGILIIPFDKEKIKEELDKFEQRTKIKFEIDVCNGVWQKDVNNYIMSFDDGHIKAKGGYVGQYNAKGIDRNSMRICDIAIVNYFVKNIPVEETINNETDIFKFQIITKTGGTYEHTYWKSENGDIEVNKVNRVYACKNKNNGNIYKTKTLSDRIKKDSVANCPEHCIVDNDNKLMIDAIDKNWYIEITKRRISDYEGN
jgi:hypothetical protein